MATQTPAQKRAREKYLREKVNVINLVVEKGRHVIYKQAAERMAVSVSKLFRLAVDEYLRNHMSGELGIEEEEMKELTEREEEMLEEFGKLPPGVQRSVTAMIRSFNKSQ